MARAAQVKHIRKAGNLAAAELGAGELGLDTTNKVWFYSTDGSTVRALNTGWTIIEKPSSQDVTNLGVTNDNDFSFAVVAGGHYAVVLDLIISGNNATGDHTFDFAVSAGTMKGRGVCQNLSAADAIQNIIVTAAAAANTTAIPTGTAADIDTLISIRVSFSFTASSIATFRYRFGNSAASGGRTSRTWKGSVMLWRNLD